MALLLIIYYITLHSTTQALPIQDIDKSTQSCRDLGHCRTIWDIIWSCLVTIFSCTWLAIHPNIPTQDEGMGWRALRRIGILIVALIAPELIIYWAIRQRIVAHKLMRKYESYQWTLAHGFFAVMGGFVLYEGKELKQTLDPYKLDKYLADGKINITEEEIKDKSKGDILTKGLVVLQTTWFILQLIARGVEHLPITEFEIVTLAFASLNFITYSVWWNKPLNVEFPVRVHATTPSHENFFQSATTGGDSQEVGGAENESIESGPSCGEVAEEDSGYTNTDQNVQRFFRFFEFKILKKIKYTFRPPSDSLFTKQWNDDNTLLGIMLLPFHLIAGIISYHHTLIFGAKRTPTFYSGSDDEASPNLIFVVLGITTTFGGIHCIAWAFHFPTSAEKLIWRVSSVLVTTSPMTFALLPVTTRFNFLSDAFDFFTRVTMFITVILYPLARLTLFVQAFMTLRSLSPNAYTTVYWTTFIPHI